MINTVLNPYLVISQDLCRVDIAILHELHAKKDVIFEKAESNQDIDALVIELRDLEFKMQEVWGFTVTEDRHTWKYLMPNSPCLDELTGNAWATDYLYRAFEYHGYPRTHH